MRVDIKFSPITITLQDSHDVDCIKNALWYYIKNHRDNFLFSKESPPVRKLELLLKEIENKHGD